MEECAEDKSTIYQFRKKEQKMRVTLYILLTLYTCLSLLIKIISVLEPRSMQKFGTA